MAIKYWIHRIFGRLQNVERKSVDISQRPQDLAVLPAPIKTSMTVPSNSSDLHEKSRTQWQFGDWASIAKIERHQIQDSRERADLALFIAAAHQQLNKHELAREYIELAKKWGCTNRQIAEILVSGVHNTLGRAAILTNDGVKATQHYLTAVSIGPASGDPALVAQVRMFQQISQLGYKSKENLATLIDKRVKPKADDPRNAPKKGISTNDDLSKRIEASEKAIRHEIEKMEFRLRASIISEVKNSTRQLELYMGLQSFLKEGEISPSLYGWPISPDFGEFLIKLISFNHYDLIVEFGSGTSTLLIARALEKTPHPGVQIAFEHLDKYYNETKSLLKTRGATGAEVILAPLVPWPHEDAAKIYPFYGCLETLRDIQTKGVGNDVLVIVDGPPASSGTHARYPALPVILEFFPHAKITFLLDDYYRPDEKEIVELWKTALENQHRKFSEEILKFEKGAALLVVEAQMAK